MINWNLYVIIDTDIIGKRDPLRVARSAINGGCDVLQLRDKRSSTKTLLKTAHALRVLTRRADIPFVVNDRVDVAMATGADGIHLGQDDLPIRAARKLIGPDKIIGISTHSLEEALAAQKEGADYISVGPIYASPFKPGMAPRETELVRQVAQNALIPFVAIGGICEDNIDEVLDAGAEIVAVIRAAVAKDNVSAATRNLKEKIRRHRERIT